MDHSFSTIRPLDYLTLFLDSREERGCVKETLKDYQIAVSNFLNAPFMPPSLAELTPLHVDMWCSLLRKSGKTDATRQWYQQQVRTFLRWAYRKKATPHNLAEEIEPVKVAERTRPSVTPKDMEKAMKTLEGRLTVSGEPMPLYYRDIALLRLLWATGIRRSGIARLTYSDVSLEMREVRVPATADKTRKFYVAPFDIHTKAALQRYFIYERGKDPGALFLSRHGDPMTPGAIHLVLRRLSEDAGVHIRCHALRRGLARRARVAGLDLGETMALLNHSDPTMTRIYTGDGESEAMLAAYRERIG